MQSVLKLIILIILMLAATSRSYAEPLLIAHEGGEYWKADNFSYITESVQKGADIIELDIRLEKGVYVVKHFRFSKNRGYLSDALDKIRNKNIYLDVKDEKIEPNELIKFVRERNKNIDKIIIGSLNTNLLKKIKKDKDIVINYHCIAPFCSIKKAKQINADWINPLPYFVTKRKIRKIQESGFKFVPGGRLRKVEGSFKKELEYAKLGAYAISIHEVKEFKDKLKEIKI